MERNQVRLVLSGVMLLGLPLMGGPAVYAAKPVDLATQNISILQSFISPANAVSTNASNIQEVKRNVDMNKTLHVRVQQTYAGYPVFGADAVVHIPNGAKFKNAPSLSSMMSIAKNEGTMNGQFYQGISADLASTPVSLLLGAQAQKAINKIVTDYQHQVGAQVTAKDQQAKMLVFIDKSNKAHWAYEVSFSVDPVKAGDLPSKPVMIVDAKTFEVYAQWNDIRTIENNASVTGGGFGGNIRMGKLSYDGLTGDLHYANYPISRDASTNKCSLTNTDVTVKNYRGGKVMTFQCDAADQSHNGVFWAADGDKVNDGYSPMDDAMFAGMVLKEMYKNWYNVPVLVESDGKGGTRPMMLNMIVHDPIDNAFWDGRQMTFGDGVSMFYPLTSLGVGAHEVSHGFTQQNSNLSYYGQSGGMNEAFSDMAAQGAEYFAYGNNSWQIGPEIFKQAGQALRYMDQPSKDCRGKKPGNWCSIDKVSQYYDGLDVHFSSGIYNRVFYLMGSATDAGWDTRKAFNVMVQANQNYWVPSTSFASGACDVISATNDLKYDVNTVKKAFADVGIDTSSCKPSNHRGNSDSGSDDNGDNMKTA